MKRFFCLMIALLCLIGMMPADTHALEAPLQISPETIRGVPVMKPVDSDIWMQTAFGGISTMDIGDDEYEEVEPNDDPENANLVENGYSVYGTLSAEDKLDFYVFTLDREMEVLVISISDKESLVMAVLDDQGNVLGAGDLVDTVDGFFIEGMIDVLPAGNYYLVALDENEGDAEYVFYLETHSHTYESVVVEPTCTDDGYTEYICECGHSYTDNPVPALGHAYGKDGVCTRCGMEKDPFEDSSASEIFTDREWEVLKLTNRERLAQGAAPLVGFGKLQQAAGIRELEIVEVFDHTRPDGTSCFSVFDEVGLACGFAGENIAMGQTTPEWVVNAWMNSEGHRSNILNENYECVGVGEVDNHWVQLFCGSDSGFTNISVSVEAPVASGTTIGEMNLAAELNSGDYGVCYLPVENSYCQGYDPNKAGVQTVTISVLGVSSTFEIEVMDHEHEWQDATCTAPKTCGICGETQGEALGHSWTEATCTAPKTCAVCGATEGTAADHSWTEATCTAPKTCVICGTTEGKRLEHEYEDGICTGCGHNENTIPMYRLYNPYTQEHLLTSNEGEMNQLVSVGWLLDGIAWNAPKSGVPVYRLYNPYDDWHTYTMSQEEIDLLVPLGWKVDGVICYSATGENALPIYRLFNPYEQKNYHLLTASVDERDLLERAGWIVEGVAWKAAK